MIDPKTGVEHAFIQYLKAKRLYNQMICSVCKTDKFNFDFRGNPVFSSIASPNGINMSEGLLTYWISCNNCGAITHFPVAVVERFLYTQGANKKEIPFFYNRFLTENIKEENENE